MKQKAEYEKLRRIVGSERGIRDRRTSSLSKLLERLHLRRLSALAEQNAWVAPNQGGFRKGRSTVEQIGALVSVLSDSLDDGGPAAALYVDPPLIHI